MAEIRFFDQHERFLKIAIADGRLQARAAELGRDIIGRKVQAVGGRGAPFQLVGSDVGKVGAQGGCLNAVENSLHFGRDGVRGRIALSGNASEREEDYEGTTIEHKEISRTDLFGSD